MKKTFRVLQGKKGEKLFVWKEFNSYKKAVAYFEMCKAGITGTEIVLEEYDGFGYNAIIIESN